MIYLKKRQNLYLPAKVLAIDHDQTDFSKFPWNISANFEPDRQMVFIQGNWIHLV